MCNYDTQWRSELRYSMYLDYAIWWLYSPMSMDLIWFDYC